MEHKDKPDVFGKCVACMTDTAGLVMGMLQTNEHYKERQFKLSNNSVMKVAFCDKCAELVKEEDFEWIMKNVILGWEYSLQKGSKSEEQKQKYRDYFFKLKIVDFA